jgi:hypothetical protein
MKNKRNKKFVVDINKKKATPFNLICPICNEVMVPWRNECEDGSGWSCGYMCGCTPEMRDKYFDELEKMPAEPVGADSCQTINIKERLLNMGICEEFIDAQVPDIGEITPSEAAEKYGIDSHALDAFNYETAGMTSAARAVRLGVKIKNNSFNTHTPDTIKTSSFADLLKSDIDNQ